MNIICWFRYINPHISHVFKSLLSIDSNLAITIMVFEDLPAQRMTLGWKSAEVEGMEVIVLEKREWFDQGQKIIRDHPEAIHVFLGLLFRSVYAMFQPQNGRPFGVFFYSIFYLMTFHFMRFGTIGFLIILFLQSMVVGVLAVLLLCRKRHKISVRSI